MIRELLTEKSISLVFGVVQGTEELNSVDIASIIEVHMYDCIIGIMMSKIYVSNSFVVHVSSIYLI